MLGAASWRCFLSALGYHQYTTRNRANDPLTKAATKAEYDHPETYDDVEQDLRSKVRPS